MADAKRQQPARLGGLPISEIKELYERAIFHTIGATPPGSRNLEAFLMLAVLLEGVLTQLGLLLLQRDANFTPLRGKRKNFYTIDKAIDDLCLMRVISVEDFKSLEKFKSDRNRCMHDVLTLHSDAAVQKYAGNLFAKHRITFETVLAKLQQHL